MDEAPIEYNGQQHRPEREYPQRWGTPAGDRYSPRRAAWVAECVRTLEIPAQASRERMRAFDHEIRLENLRRLEHTGRIISLAVAERGALRVS
ncbi:MAG: hypothetical protein WAL50_12465 [Kineosporiaceae bacterium]